MKSLNNTTDRTPRSRWSWLRFVVELVSHPAFANHTPVGPLGIAAGHRPGAACGQLYIGSDDCGQRECQHDAQPSHMEYAVPLRQVFWI